jgi:hypothetical protein
MNIKYKVEGELDFFSELYKSLDIDNDISNEKIDESNICLITQQPLTNKYVEMKCGHKFNYIPLYNDLTNFKQKFNSMEGINTRLKNNEIRCPYCRRKQNELLPYYEELGLEKIDGVNFYDKTYVDDLLLCSKCEFLVVNLDFNHLEPESVNNKKFITCKSSYVSKIKIYNPLNPSSPLNYGDNKLYCYQHKKQMIKQYKLQEKQKQKEKAKEEKQKQKEKAKEEKQKEKEKAKEEKQKQKEKAKEEKQKNNTLTNDNNLASSSNIIEIELNSCVQIIKSGINKGNKCGCKIHLDNLCKRHYSIQNKNI